jgi:hypothetical protein
VSLSTPFFMNKNAQIILVSILAQSANAAVLGWNEGQILGLRTNNTVGFVFDGAPASSVDADGNGVIDDGQTGFYSSINVDSEGSASLDLNGDDFDWAMRFQMYDADGVFAFTENFDDSARVSVTPILSNTNLGSRGAASTLIDDADSGSSWNTRTFGNYDFAGGGWFDVTVELDEKGGGAQSAGGIGFGFFNGNSTLDTDFQGIGYESANGQATFDVAGNGASFGVLTSTVPEPTTPILGLIGVLGLALRRRK